MEVRPGYKQTEVGMIPEDWEVKRLGSILKLRYGKSQREIMVDGGSFPILATGGVVGRTNHYLYDKPSVIIGRKGTLDIPQYVDTPFWAIDTTYYTEISEAANPKYLFYLFTAVHWYSYNEASGVPSLSATTVGNIEISLPPVAEQRAIAAALSDMDGLISGLERLIEKKRAIKQGAMQQLLTGKTRLPGFQQLPGYKQTETGIIPKDLTERGLGSVVEIVGGGTPSTGVAEYWGGQIPWVSAGDISRASGRYVLDTSDHISELGLASCPAKMLPKGTVVIIARGATVGRMAQLGREMAFNQTCYGMKPTAILDQDYLYYAMKYSIDSIRALTYGTIFGTITTQSFRDWRIPLPAPAEQTAIAAVLSDMDAEIAALEARRHKTRLLKEGMMQELLTGRIRLNHD